MNPTIVFDLDGVVYLGDEEVPGAGSVLSGLSERGFTVLFATNNSWRSADEGAAKIRRVTGYRAEPSQYVSSASAAASLLGPHDGPVLILGGPGIVDAVEGAGAAITEDPTEATVVIAGLDRQLTYEKLHLASSAVRNGARFIATNLDPTFPTPTGLMPGAGSMVAAVETASGTAPEVAGKPYPPMRHLVTELASGGSVWMVGDRVDTDLAMAYAEAFRSPAVMGSSSPSATVRR
jgi:4-nitrophenyl phosphatase